MYVKFELPQGEFLVGNTHLSWKPDDDETRRKQADELVSGFGQEGVSSILCGDFNCEYPSAPLKGLRDSGFQDLMEGFPDASRPSWDNKNPFIADHRTKFPDRRIDLILANEAFRSVYSLKDIRITLNTPKSSGHSSSPPYASQLKTLDLYPSDHYGILATF